MWGAFYQTQGSLPGKGCFPVVQSLGCQGRPMRVGVICLLPGSLSPRNQTKDKWEMLVGSHSLDYNTGRHSKSCSEGGTGTEEQSIPILGGACGNYWATSAVGAKNLSLWSPLSPLLWDLGQVLSHPAKLDVSPHLRGSSDCIQDPNSFTFPESISLSGEFAVPLTKETEFITSHPKLELVLLICRRDCVSILPKGLGNPGCFPAVWPVSSVSQPMALVSHQPTLGITACLRGTTKACRFPAPGVLWLFVIQCYGNGA